MPRFSDDQIRAIITQPTELRIVTWPARPEIRIAVRCLDEVELDGCRIEAQRRIRDIASKRRWDVRETADIDPTLLERFVEREIVLRAFFDADTIDSSDPVPFFSSEIELARIGSVGVTDLITLYTEHQEWVNPGLFLGEEDEQKLVELLGKGPSAEVSLTGYELPTLRRLLISTAKRLFDSPAGRSTTSNA